MTTTSFPVSSLNICDMETKGLPVLNEILPTNNSPFLAPIKASELARLGRCLEVTGTQLIKWDSSFPA